MTVFVLMCLIEQKSDAEQLIHFFVRAVGKIVCKNPSGNLLHSCQAIC